MHIRDLAGKNLCILGYGREGVATAKALLRYATGCTIVVADENPAAELRNPEIRMLGDIGFQTGSSYLQHLDRFDVVIKSPGIPPKELPAKLPPVTTPTQIFLDSIKNSGATVIGVTGSKGKSTVSSLIHAILKAAGKRSFLIGNIGEPAISHIEDANSNTFFVQEMSSYQLMDLTSSPHIAVITSFFPEHLDYHRNFENYLEAKKHITRFQNKNDVVFFNADSDGAKKIAVESKGVKIPFSAGGAPVTLKDIQLKGEHNLGNIAAAFAVATHLGIDHGTAVAAIKSFKGLPHRLESLGVQNGIEWINDSISTTPESAVAALDALEGRVETMILGGQDRGYDFLSLVKRLQTSSVKTVILMPDSGATIRKKLEEAKMKLEMIDALTMQEAVAAAKKLTQESDSPIVLLSPAAPSYGHFKNFEDRGDQFGKCIFTTPTP